jgi:nucleotide-binding universal stress UspA family protein
MSDPDAASPPQHRSMVVGVLRQQSDAVLREAVRLARRFGAELVFATVDTTRYTVIENVDGTVSSLPIDLDLPEPGEAEFDPQLEERVREAMAGSGVEWSVRVLAGDPADSLARLAEKLDAEAIVVGTRERGIRAGFAEFFRGSVAVHLAHRQRRPVIVIPQAPVGDEEAMPWDEQV